MPRPTMPLTPADSTEIHGKERTASTSTEPSFNLPSPVLGHESKGKAGTTSHRLIQPAVNSSYALPPPPTRSRKIIHMTPKSSSQESETSAPQQGAKGPSRNAKPNSKPTAPAKKQQSTTSAAGKKMARKTAHSVIERRRRSKMNEEFGTLKEMIPACKGQEMHKLAILQASIDYLRYLQSCIGELKAANNALSTPLVQPQAPMPRRYASDEEEPEEGSESEGEASDHSEQSDQEMPDANTSPSSPLESRQPNPYKSPLSLSNSTQLEKDRYQHRSSFSSSILPSPAVEAKEDLYHHRHSLSTHSSTSANTSPSMLPNTEQDEEATAALLMLTHDRRHLASQGERGKRGMSVKDLLSN